MFDNKYIICSVYHTCSWKYSGYKKIIFLQIIMIVHGFLNLNHISSHSPYGLLIQLIQPFIMIVHDFLNWNHISSHSPYGLLIQLIQPFTSILCCWIIVMNLKFLTASKRRRKKSQVHQNDTTFCDVSIFFFLTEVFQAKLVR